MEVILLERVRKLGELGAQVTVKRGYGRNYLVPSGKAVLATAENIKYFDARRAELEKKQQDQLQQAAANVEKIAALVLTIKRKVGTEGKLFGSVNVADIVQAATDAGVTLTKHQIKLPDGPIRATGDYDIKLQLHADVSTSLKVQILAEE